MSPTAKVWQLLPHDRVAIERLSAALGVAPVVAQLLLNRGLADLDAARHFLDAPFRGLREPESLPGVTEAADRLHAAARDGRKICVYGDYDVDGLTGTAILLETLRVLGAAADFYVPHRLDEGYGVNAEALRQIAANGTAVVVTVDCGIASVAEADEARRLGLELIITDHHEPKEELPRADAIVHPRLPGTTYPFGHLSGSGVAFKLAWALCQRASGSTRVTPHFRERLLDSVTLAALGMVADVVPLLDENRIFVRHGLARLRECASVGLKALLEVAGLDGRLPTAGDIGYYVAPRLNAAGRLGCARLVVELLTTTNAERAKETAKFLNHQNEERQRIERRMLAQAREQLAAYELESLAAIVLANSNWHAGVIGIVAGRLAQLYGRPVLMISLKEDAAVGFGSGRSVPGFPLHEALRACGDGLVSHGGHAAAAGFKIPHDHVPAFRDRFCAYAGKHFAGSFPAPQLVIDAEAPLSIFTLSFVESLAKLEPYGAGNPRPLFLSGPAQLVGEPRRVGGGERHLSFRVRQEGTTLRAIAFNLGDRAEELTSAGGYCSVVFTPSINEWQGWRSVQIEVQDFQHGRQPRLAT